MHDCLENNVLSQCRFSVFLCADNLNFYVLGNEGIPLGMGTELTAFRSLSA